jgi:hypothetical protein
VLHIHLNWNYKSFENLFLFAVVCCIMSNWKLLIKVKEMPLNLDQLEAGFTCIKIGE